MEGIRFTELFEGSGKGQAAKVSGGPSWHQRWRWGLAGLSGVCGMLVVLLLGGALWGSVVSPPQSQERLQAQQAQRAELSSRLVLAASEARSGLWEAFSRRDALQGQQILNGVSRNLETVREAAAELARPLPADSQGPALSFLYAGVTAIEAASRELEQGLLVNQRGSAYGAVAVKAGRGLEQILNGQRELEKAWQAHKPVPQSRNASAGFWLGLGSLLIVALGSVLLLSWLAREAAQTFGGIGETLRFRAGLLEDAGRAAGLGASLNFLESEVTEEGQEDAPAFSWRSVRERCGQNHWQGKAALQKSLDLQRMLRREARELTETETDWREAVGPSGALSTLPRELERLTYAAQVASMEASAEAATLERTQAVQSVSSDGRALAGVTEGLRQSTTLQVTADELQRLAEAGTAALTAWQREGAALLERGATVAAHRATVESKWATLEQLSVELHDLLRQAEASTRGQSEAMAAMEAAWRESPEMRALAKGQKRFAEEVRAVKGSAELLLRHSGRAR